MYVPVCTRACIRTGVSVCVRVSVPYTGGNARTYVCKDVHTGGGRGRGGEGGRGSSVNFPRGHETLCVLIPAMEEFTLPQIRGPHRGAAGGRSWDGCARKQAR